MVSVPDAAALCADGNEGSYSLFAAGHALRMQCTIRSLKYRQKSATCQHSRRAAPVIAVMPFPRTLRANPQNTLQFSDDMYDNKLTPVVAFTQRMGYTFIMCKRLFVLLVPYAAPERLPCRGDMPYGTGFYRRVLPDGFKHARGYSAGVYRHSRCS